jgi:hypothetical protein
MRTRSRPAASSRQIGSIESTRVEPKTPDTVPWAAPLICQYGEKVITYTKEMLVNPLPALSLLL